MKFGMRFLQYRRLKVSSTKIEQIMQIPETQFKFQDKYLNLINKISFDNYKFLIT